MAEIKVLLHISYPASTGSQLAAISQTIDPEIEATPTQFEQASYIEIVQPHSRLSIGRSLHSDLYIPDPAVSNRHCYLENIANAGEPNRLRIVDQDSANGTFYGTTRISEQVLTEKELHRVVLANRVYLRLAYVLLEKKLRPAIGEFDPRLLLGQNLGDFYLESLLKTRGSSFIYKGMQRSPRREVAVKVLKHAFSRNEKAAKRFRRFTRIAASLAHPALVAIHQSGICYREIDAAEYNLFYIAMEYLEGVSLAEKLKRQHKLTSPEACQLMLQVAHALSYLHKNRIIHRNLAPSHIIITNAGSVKLTGIRLLKKLAPEQQRTLTIVDQGLTQLGVPLGVLGYASLEELMGEKDINAAADIYSLGAIFYHCVCGRPPYSPKIEGNFAREVVRIRNEIRALAPPPILPKQFADIIMKCLHEDKSCRYSSVDEIIADLNDVVQKKIEMVLNFYGLFPPAQEITDDFHLEVAYKPYEEIGGDFYLYDYDQQHRKLLFVLGDVSGHGAPASMVVALLMGFLKLLMQYQSSPQAIFEELHRRVKPCLSGMTFVEALCGVIDFATQQLTICQAGRTPLLVYNPRRSVPFTIVQNSGTLIGLALAPEFCGSETVIDLIAGDILISCTDGVFETGNSDEDGKSEEYGLDRIGKLLEQNYDCDLVEILGQIFHDVNHFARVSDDITILCLKPVPAPAQAE